MPLQGLPPGARLRTQHGRVCLSVPLALAPPRIGVADPGRTVRLGQDLPQRAITKCNLPALQANGSSLIKTDQS